MYVSFLDGFIVFVLPCQFSMRSSIVLQTLTWLQNTVRWIKFKWNYTYENINSIWKRCGEREGEKETSRNIHIWLWMCARCERNDTVTDRKRQIFWHFWTHTCNVKCTHPRRKKTVHTSVHPYKRVTNAVCISVLASEFFIISFRFEQCRPASKLGSQNK